MRKGAGISMGLNGKRARPLVGLGGFVAVLMVISSVFNLGATRGEASSHREAPQISADPQADNTDLYAFVSPDAPDTVTIIASFYPGQDPAGGPNFYNFGDDVVYDLKIDNNHDAVEDVIYRFDFNTVVNNPNTFLYNTGPIESLDSENWNVRQYYTITEFRGGTSQDLAFEGVVPPYNIGPGSTPDYEALSNAAIGTIPTDAGDIKVFAGPSDDPFWLDLGGIFDLLAIRGDDAIDDLAGFNVLTIAMQLPIGLVTGSGEVPADAADPDAVVGVWSTTSRFSTTVIGADGSRTADGDLVQVSRLGMPLVNEVVVPLGAKDLFNASIPADDGQFLGGVTNPELPGLLNAIYGIEVPEGERTDLVAVFLTGVAGLNFVEGGTPSEMLRLNVAIPPTDAADLDAFGVIAGDLGGFPNGRRLQDEVVDISLRVVAGILFAEEFNVEPNNALDDGVTGNDVPFREEFPYVALPHQGADNIQQNFSDGGAGGEEPVATEAAEDDATAAAEDDATEAAEEEATEEATEVALDTLTIDLAELDGSGVSGTAVLTAAGDETEVVLELEGATGGHPAHIHQGTCEELEPNPEYPLPNVDEDGNSEETVPASLADELTAEPHAINIHLSDAEIGVYVACGNIVAE